MAALYILRSDPTAGVRQCAALVWKDLVSNTPRMVSEVMSQFVAQVMALLASPVADMGTLAGRALGEASLKLGDKLLPVAVPLLQARLADRDKGVRRSVCVGLTEILSNSGPR